MVYSIGMQKLSLILMSTLILSAGCLSDVPQGLTAAPPEQISSCHSYATVHNITMFSGLGLSVTSGALGTVETQTSNESTKTTLGWTLLGTAIASAILTAITSVESQNYSSAGCVSITGPLPVAVPKPKDPP